MARILNAKCRLCRREGKKLFLKGKRCYGPKCPLDKKGAVPPGIHGQKKRTRLSEFGMQLREKQKVKRIYGINEKQMKSYFLKSKKTAGKSTGEYLLQLLESRLDNVVFRAGFTPSRSVARQMVTHGHFLVDNRKINIPSYQIKKDQVVSVSSKALDIPIIKSTLEAKIMPPKWLEKKGAAVKMVRLPEKKEIEADINEQLIVEFYSR